MNETTTDRIIKEYLTQGEISKENANMSFGPSGLLLVVGGEGLKKNYLKRIDDAGFINLPKWHKLGKIHIHDLSLSLQTPYCAGHSLLNLITDGIETSSVKSSPAKHLSSLINHMVNYIGCNSNDFAGAQAFNDIDIFLAPYAYKTYLDFKKQGCSRSIAFKLTRDVVYQQVQSFVFHMNYNSRWGSQSPFSNITLSITIPDDLKDMPAIVGGHMIKEYYNYMEDGVKVNNHTYGDLGEWQQLVVDAILDTFLAGDAEGKAFTFPVLTINVTEDFFDNPNSDKICDLANKFGTPFFQNYINGVGGGKKMATSDVRSMCCFSGNEVIEVYNKRIKTTEIYKLKDFVNMFVKKENNIAKKIDKGYEIVSFDGNNAKKTNIVGVLKKENTSSNMIKLTVNDRTISVTPDHKFVVKVKETGKMIEVFAREILNSPDRFWIPILNDVKSLFWDSISSCEKIKSDKEVYDIELEKHHYFPANDIISHNCRLSIDINELRAHTGGLFGNGDQTGSLQVVTISLPYVAKEFIESGSKDQKEFFNELSKMMEEIKDEQLWKREIVDKYFEMGFFELAKQNFKRGFDTFFTTIGFIGLWECVEMLKNDDRSFLTDDGMELAKKILNFMTNKCNEFISETGKLFNLEATPAEGATYKLAKKALKQYPDISHRGLKKNPYFTNSCHLPVEYQNDLSLIFETQNELQTIPTGGTVTHFTTGEVMTRDEIKEAIKTICQTKIPFFSINSVFSICPICGYQKGNHQTCPNKHSEEDLINLYKKNPSRFIF